MIETERLILRRWSANDAEECYKYAKDPLVGPAAGWPVHTSVEDSRRIIEDVLDVPETYAIVLKKTGLPIGSIGLHFYPTTDLTQESDECELGYWIGRPYWGHGYAPEAARAAIEYAFDTLNLTKIWCGYYEGNDKSKRVQQKCGFVFHHISYDVRVHQLSETRNGYVNVLTREMWESKKTKN